MKMIEPLNYGWKYSRKFCPAYVYGPEDGEWEQVDLPHTNTILPYNYLNEKDYQFVSCYARELFAPDDWQGKRVFLQFEGVMNYAKVYCNGELIRDHKGGYTAFSAELTKYLRCREENRIVVEVDSTERADIPPCGNVVDYLTYGGIYREVTLFVTDPEYISDVQAAAEKNGDSEQIGVRVSFGEALPADRKLTAVLCDRESNTIAEITKNISAGSRECRLAFCDMQGLVHWSIEKPELYSLCVTLSDGQGQEIDREKIRYGHRFCHFAPDGFYLNGEKIKLIGLNRHQSYPYVGNAMPARVQARDADILKFEMGVNLVRTSHYPQSRHFLDRCDEIGLLVFEEIPGWQHIGDEAWQAVAVQNVEEMIVHDYNHPSIILWGVRINESQDNHDFYTRTNALAHQLDSSRQTGGVRYKQRSELLEDVYTFNDFVYSGGEKVLRNREEATGLQQPVPLLVTECNGHMYPTKRFDHEDKLTEHAKRHLQVMNEATGREDITGVIGWCAFDYNTHASFGSGDKICYHGVYDMFRIPKYAGFAYASQKPVEKGAVLEILSVVSRGERNGGGIVPILVATNCDFVRVYKDGQELGDYYPDRKHYPHLAHPPVSVCHLFPKDTGLPISAEDVETLKEFVVRKVENGELTDLTREDFVYLSQFAQQINVPVEALLTLLIKTAGGWGDRENNLRFVGYYQGRPVIEKQAGESKCYGQLDISPDETILHAEGDTYDAVRIVVRALDDHGNLMPFYNAGVTVETDDMLTVMGPEQVPLIGGCTAFWVRTQGKTGVSHVTVHTSRETHTIEIQILP